MASIGQLVRVVAEVSGLEESAVKLIARYVREAGLIGQKSTGGGAATMTSIDAAALLIAVNGTSLAKDSAEAVRDFASLPVEAGHDSTTQVPDLKEVGDRLSRMDIFGACLAMLIQIYTSEKGECLRTRPGDPWSVDIKIVFERPRSTGSIFIFERKDKQDAMQLVFGRVFSAKSEHTNANVDRSVAVTIGDKTIAAVAEVIAI